MSIPDLDCPYCGAGNDVCHDDGLGYEEDKPHEMECGECGKNFVFYTATMFHYRPRKADCLNGDSHPFMPWVRLWDHDGKRIEQRGCKDCGEYERRTIDIPKEEP